MEMKNITIVIFLAILNFSCKPYKTFYRSTPRDLVFEKEIGSTADYHRIFIIVENSMVGSKFFVQSINTKEVFFDGIIHQNPNNSVAQIIKADNHADTFLFIDEHRMAVPAGTKDEYRYLIIKKPKKESNKFTLTYTNQMPLYW